MKMRTYVSKIDVLRQREAFFVTWRGDHFYDAADLWEALRAEAATMAPETDPNQLQLHFQTYYEDLSDAE